MVPQLNSRADAERLVKAVKYPLAGERGFAAGRGSQQLDLSPPAYMRRANEETFTMPLFENIAGLDELDAALQVQGIDMLYLGQFDLASSLGLPGSTVPRGSADGGRTGSSNLPPPEGAVRHRRSRSRPPPRDGPGR